MLLPDTGANTALFNNARWFGDTLTPTSGPVTGLGGQTQPDARGTATVSVVDDTGTTRALAFEAQLDRSVPVNLVSLRDLKAAGLTKADWSGDTFRWQFKALDYGQDFTISTRPTAANHGLHVFNIEETRSAPLTHPIAGDILPVALIASTTTMTLREAHEALGHIDVHRLRGIAATVQGITLARHTRQDLDNFRCIDCAAGKQPRAPRPPGPHDPISTKFGVHCMVDAIGPLPLSRQQFEYLLVFVDNMGAVRTFPHRSTADSHHALSAWARVWQSDTSTRPTIQMDQASYFAGGEFQNVLKTLGWRQTWSPPYAHSLAGRTERMNRLLLDRVRPMLYGAGLNASFWPEAAAYAAWLTFRQVTTRGVVSPYELMHGAQPDMRHAHRFGALVHYRDDRPLNKLAPRTRQGLFMGIPLDTSFGTVLIYTLDTGRFVESRDYSVFPDITPGAQLRNVTTANGTIPNGIAGYRDPEIELIVDTRASTANVVTPPTATAQPASTTDAGAVDVVGANDSEGHASDNSTDTDTDHASASGSDSDGAGSHVSAGGTDNGDEDSHASAGVPDDGDDESDDGSDAASGPASPIEDALPPPPPLPAPLMRLPRAAHNTPHAQHKSHAMPTNISGSLPNTKSYANNKWQPAYSAQQPLEPATAQDATAATEPGLVPVPAIEELAMASDAATVAAPVLAPAPASDVLEAPPQAALFAAQPSTQPGVQETEPRPGATPICPDTWSDYQALPPHQRAIWAKALHKEFDALKSMGTLSPVPIHIARSRTPRIIQSRWLFKLKTATVPGGDQVAKARLVCRGFQEPGLSKENVFAPTVAPATLRIMVAIALCFGWRSAYVDFSTAFLNSTVAAEEHLYIYPPPGVDMPGYVFQLLGALYGLASSPVRWFNTVVPLLLAYGLQQHPQDPCLFWMTGSASTPPLILVLFVDDIRLAGPGDACERFIAYLQSTHKCTSKPQGEYLSMTFDDPLGGMIKAHQLRYSTDILNDLVMNNCIPRLSPLPGGRTLLEADESELLAQDAAAWYRTGVGKVGYLLQTKPDLCFAFSELSRHLIKPGKCHLEALEHVIGYVSKHSTAGFTIFRDELPLRVTAYSDSNYATDIDDRKSVSGKCIFVGRSPVMFSTSRQTTLATSSAEAELTALFTTCLAAQEVRDLLEPLGLLADGPSRVYCDSEAAIATVKGGSRQLVRGLAKHHAVRLLKLRELLDDGMIDLQPINSADNIADIFTKAVSAPDLRRHLAAMNAGSVWGLPDSRGTYPPPGRPPRK